MDELGEVKAILTTLYKIDKIVLKIANSSEELGKTGEVLIGSYFTGDIANKCILPTRHQDSGYLFNIDAHSNYKYLIDAIDQKPLAEEYIDYRGKRVMVATSYVNHVGWGLVVKIDIDEVEKDFSFF